MKMKKALSWFLLLALLPVLSACAAGAPAASKAEGAAPGVPDNTAALGYARLGETPEGASAGETALRFAADYAEVLRQLRTAQDRSRAAAGGGARSSAALADFGANETMSAPAAEKEAPTDVVGTNVQVEGIDEGDVLKTDGQYLYLLRDSRLLILEAREGRLRLLSETTVGYSEHSQGEDDSFSGRDKSPQELYLYDGRLVLLSDYNAYSSTPAQEGNGRRWQSESYSMLDFYDVSDPARPVLLESLGQDGYRLGSRLKDGRLYLVTNYAVYEYDEDEPSTFVPSFYRDGKAVPMSAGRICIGPWPSRSTSYVVAAVYDVSSAERTQEQSILGGGGELYMSQGSIYVSGSEYEEESSQPRRESVYTVVEHNFVRETKIFRFDVSEGLELAAAGKVPGYLDSQFSMDEYNGTLRLVSTLDSYRYTTYTDEAMDFVNYRWPEEQESPTNGLYILDADLNTVGKLDGLAEDERVYSVRFDGDVAYFCTYRNVDPLFAVDLSDPAAPAVLSALKLSGFSEYLHPWGEGRLFGAGYEADEDTGRLRGVKLVMFDTSDKTDVDVLHTLNTGISSSEAMVNHKAFLISPGHALIGFPGEKSYFLYGYDAGEGFSKLAELELEHWSYNFRGVYIDGFVYVAGYDSVAAIDASDWTLLAELSLPAREES